MDFITVLIILLGCITIGLFVWCILISRNLDNILQPRTRRANPSRETKEETPEDIRNIEDDVVKKCNKMNMIYSCAVNCTTAFPLLGMLGTVISLMSLAGNMDGQEIPVDQFFMALRTTMWGIIGGIIGKGFDAYVSVKVAANNKETDTLLERNSGGGISLTKTAQEKKA
ncbi:MAG: MotA/TolQ/ExbB proton channel family protein [Oscillospiraceae bacterium]|nr:MotA/TolQ/ExbB proton channel family protein [Oscillospiraceae bacterium]